MAIENGSDDVAAAKLAEKFSVDPVWRELVATVRSVARHQRDKANRAEDKTDANRLRLEAADYELDAARAEGMLLAGANPAAQPKAGELERKGTCILYEFGGDGEDREVLNANSLIDACVAETAAANEALEALDLAFYDLAAENFRGTRERVSAAIRSLQATNQNLRHQLEELDCVKEVKTGRFELFIETDEMSKNSYVHIKDNGKSGDLIALGHAGDLGNTPKYLIDLLNSLTT